jgi:hypothetical protein
VVLLSSDQNKVAHGDTAASVVPTLGQIALRHDELLKALSRVFIRNLKKQALLPVLERGDLGSERRQIAIWSMKIAYVSGLSQSQAKESRREPP